MNSELKMPRKTWTAPEIIVEQALVVRAQEPTDSDDPFLGPLSTSGT